MKKIILAIATAIGFSSAVSAADLRVLPVRAAPIYAPVPALTYQPVFNWSGCYVGGHVGAARYAEDVKVYDVDGYNLLNVDYWSYGLDWSFIGGGTLGCNWQPLGSVIVLGVEGEAGYLNQEGAGYDPFDPARSIVSSTKIGPWYGMITGRMGYALDRLMVYIKGGIAFLDVETAVVDPIVNPGFIATDSETAAAWTVGGGVEYALDWNWSLKAEYMFIGLETYAACGATAGGLSFCWDHEVAGIHTAKIGVNYRFGGSAPLVARY